MGHHHRPPAPELAVVVERCHGDAWQHLARACTDADGRVGELYTPHADVRRLRIDTGRYFVDRGVHTSYPEVVVTFSLPLPGPSAASHGIRPLISRSSRLCRGRSACCSAAAQAATSFPGDERPRGDTDRHPETEQSPQRSGSACGCHPTNVCGWQGHCGSNGVSGLTRRALCLVRRVP
ncbi:hydroxyisourate hydrolase [Micromonospora sp. KLBMP9576]|uniref:hydroxyisourate hydrolase n=1 Tax=Micromonospora sp. KLBMP9576 TaxID=3424769 RepID=UPI003D8CD88E